MSIVPFLEGSAFGPQDIEAMSTALEDVCKTLNLADEAKSERELLAKKIIAFARQMSGQDAEVWDAARLVAPLQWLQARDQRIGGE
jgi:hypothetical protein